MSAKITRLRIAGFKSFADPATIDILPGLTGIVGPNGCGKSNVVEALRWAMGESSARALRGGELDDLIFAGTSARSARSLAEVTLWLDEAQGLAPPPFSETDGLEITRRAERGSGSEFRLNGRALRARDITTMFADLSSGARSSSIVSQNRVSALISAKPEERRSLLEEAAGITGLHARRHDAEIKLRQAEGNMERSEDLRQQIETRLATLDAQSVQARAYRSLSAAIRADELTFTWLVHRRAALLVERTREQLEAAEKSRDDSARAADEAGQQGAAGRERLLALRDHTDALRTTRDRLRVISESTREAVAQAQARHEQTTQRHEQMEADHQLALKRLEELTQREALLNEEEQRLAVILRELPDTLVTLREAAQESAELLSRLEQTRLALADKLTTRRMTAQALTLEHEAAAKAVEALTDESTTLAKAITELRDELPDETALEQLTRRLDEQRQERTALDQQIQQQAQLRQEQLVNTSKAEQDLARIEREARENREMLARLTARASNLDQQIAAHQSELEALEAARLDEDALDALDTEAATLMTARDVARATAEESRSALAQIEQQLGAQQAEARSIARQRELLEKDRDQARQSLERLNQSLETLIARREALGRDMPDDATISDATGAREAAQRTLSSLIVEIETISQARRDTQQARDEAENALRLASADHLALVARRDALQANTPDDALPDPALAQMEIPAGLERAVAAALGQTLEASLDTLQSRAWQALPPLSPAQFGAGCTSLSALIKAPEALQRCLDHVGLIDSEQDPEALQTRLLPGQCLVTSEGALWRWDGYREAANLPSTALSRVEHLAALRDLDTRIAAAEAAIPALRATLGSFNKQDADHAAKLTGLRETVQREEKNLSTLKQAETSLLDRRDRLAGQIAQIDQNSTETTIQRDETRDRLNSAVAGLEALGDEAKLHEALRVLNGEVSRQRSVTEAAITAASQIETDYTTAQQDATRQRLQNDSCIAKLATIGAVLKQARADHDDVAGQRQALSQNDHDAALASARTVLEQCKSALVTGDRERAALKTRLEALGRDMGHSSRELQTRRDLKLSLNSRLAALTPRQNTVKDQLARATQAQEALAPIPDLAPFEAELSSALAAEADQRERDLAARTQVQEAQSRLDQATQEKHAIALRLGETRAQGETLRDDCSRLEERLTLSMEEISRSAAERTAQDEALQTHHSALQNAEQAHEQAAIALTDLDKALQDLAHSQREEEQRGAQARENAIRLQERLAQALAQHEKLAETPLVEPESPPDIPLTEASETTIKRRLARAQKDREALGPVNLLAEQEYTQAKEQSDHLTREHEELTSAIQRLRGSINALKKEGRERLQAVFVEVDRHFQSLFSRMFNGGKAHLGLVGSDDPLEAGLEIFAQPPGKKLSTLSLLSGGEQALTALSLIFATFRCQPSPLCILDEVDAPLDDANVERLCGLLKDMAEEAQTRFLIVTHHQLTMAHMDRLFGVTMQERGVSQVLSVDLSLAAAFAESGNTAVASR